MEMALKPFMKQLGFKKAGPTWHRSMGIGVQVLNIQGSQWSKSFYLNLGVYFHALGCEERPREYQCHIRQRLCQLVDDLPGCNDTLSFDIEMEPEARVTELRHMVSVFAIPWLEQHSDFDGARTYLSDENRVGFPVQKETWEYLGIKPRS